MTGEKLLLIASEQWELAGLVRHAREERALSLPVDYARSIRLKDDRQWTLLANGPGPHLAAEALTAGIRNGKPAAVVSVGCCGGLDPALRAGDIVMASQVVDSDTGTTFEASMGQLNKTAHRVAMASGNRVVRTAEQKRQLRAATGAGAVDMESAALARGARDAGLPFYCIRVVTDTALEDLHNDFNAARGPDGRFSKLAIVTGALLRPFSRVPELIRLAGVSRRATTLLGDCLASCQF